MGQLVDIAVEEAVGIVLVCDPCEEVGVKALCFLQECIERELIAVVPCCPEVGLRVVSPFVDEWDHTCECVPFDPNEAENRRDLKSYIWAMWRSAERSAVGGAMREIVGFVRMFCQAAQFQVDTNFIRETLGLPTIGVAIPV